MFDTAAVGRDVSALSRTDQIALLRDRMAAIPARGQNASSTLFEPPAPTIATPAMLAELLPRAGLARGSVCSFEGTSWVLLALLASVTASGEHAAVIGFPRLGFLAAHEMGADLRRVAWVPKVPEDPCSIASVVVEGVPLTLLDLAGADVAPSRVRAIRARVQKHEGVLVASRGRWPAPDLRISGRVVGFEGLELGHGRIRSVVVETTVTGKGVHRSGRYTLRPDGDGATSWSGDRAVRHVVAM